MIGGVAEPPGYPGGESATDRRGTPKPSVTRHDEALKLLAERFDYIGNEVSTKGGKSYERGDTLGIAGGICKRRWNDLGRLEDLLAAATFYWRGAECEMGDDAYPHINAAFVEDLLAKAGDQPERRRAKADSLRERILKELKPSTTWWNAATRAEPPEEICRGGPSARAVPGRHRTRTLATA